MDPDQEQFGEREAGSISDDNQSLQELNFIIDQLEQEEMEALNLDLVSSREEELKVDWEVSRSPSPEITFTPDVSSQQFTQEIDLSLSVDSVSPPPPPSLDSFFPCSLIEDSAFSIEKVLGETTANILAEAEAEASKYATGLQQIDIEWVEDGGQPHRLLTCQICQLFVRTVDRLLDKSEQLMDHYLPLTEEEIANLKKAVEELGDSTTDHEMHACFARISNLSGKLRQRAYMMALSKLRLARRNTEENLSQLQQTIDLIGQVQHAEYMDCQKSLEKLTEISLQWSQRNSIQQASLCTQSEYFSPVTSSDEIGPRLAQSSDNEDLGTSVTESSKTEEKEEPPAPSEPPEMVPTPPSEEATPPPELPPTPPAEEAIEVPPSPPTEVIEPEVPPSPPTEEEIEAPPSPPTEVIEPEMPPSPPPEVIEPEMPPSPPTEEEIEVPPSPPPEVIEPEMPPSPPTEEEIEVPPSPPTEVIEPEVPPSPPTEEEIEMPPTPPSEVIEPEVPPSPPTEEEIEVPPSPPTEVTEPEMPPTPPPEVIEPEMPPSPPTEEEIEVPPTPPPEVIEPEVPPTPPPEVIEPEVPPTPPPEVIEPEVPPPPPPKVVKKEQVHRDVANITLTNPGCDEDVLMLKKAGSEEEASFTSEVEAKTLAMSRSLTSNLKDTYESLLANLKDLPTHLQNKLYQTCRDMSELHSSFASAHSFSDLSTGILNKSFEVMAEAQGSMDELMEYALQSPKALLWLKDYLPPVMTLRQEPKGDDESPNYELQVEASPSSIRGKESNILKIQQAFDPKECYDETPFRMEEKEVEEAPPSIKSESQDILKIQQAYDPKDCDEDTFSSKEEKDVASSDKEDAKDWGIMKILEAYVPKISNIQAFSNKKEEDVPSSVQKEEENLPAQEEEEVFPLSREDIVKLQQAYDPKGCDEDTPSKKEEEDMASSEKQATDWGIMKILGAYIPQLSGNEASSVKKEVPPAAEREDARGDILKIQKAYEPKECDEGTLSIKEEKEVAPSIKEAADPVVMKIPEVYVPQISSNEEPSVKKQEEVPPPVEKNEEIPPAAQKEEETSLPSRDDIFKPQENEDPKESDELPVDKNENAPPLDKEEEKAPSPVKEKSIEEIQEAQEIQTASDPKDCGDEPPVVMKEEKVSPPRQREVVDIIKIQQAYDPKECEEVVSHREEGVAAPTSGNQEWSILKIMQSYLPKSSKDEALPGSQQVGAEGQDREAPPGDKGERTSNILNILQAYEPKGCEDK